MVEEIKLLLPLLENTQEGAFWLILLYFGLKLMGYILPTAVILIVVWWVKKLFLHFKDPFENWAYYDDNLYTKSQCRKLSLWLKSKTVEELYKIMKIDKSKE
jgi:hypothetical protein